MRSTLVARVGLVLVAGLGLVGCGDDRPEAGPHATGSASSAAGEPVATGGERRPLLIAHQGGDLERPSDTLYSFRQAVAGGADMLDLDIGVTADNRVVVLHDTTLGRTTNGAGNVSDTTLAGIGALDAAYWFCSDGSTGPDCPSGQYPFRGIATGDRPAPEGSCAGDFRIPTLDEVLAAFPDIPATIEIKGRTPAETDAEYVANAEVLAALLAPLDRTDLTVVSFRQAAVDRFHQLAPDVAVSPGITNAAGWVLQGTPPGNGVRSFQLPIQYQGTPVTTEEAVARAHSQGFAWFVWLDADTEETPGVWRRVLDQCVDGVDTGRPTAFAEVRAAWITAGGADRCAPAWAGQSVAAAPQPPAEAVDPTCS
jgi:glycerophosphoryl diester phosphodiesterase